MMNKRREKPGLVEIREYNPDVDFQDVKQNLEEAGMFEPPWDSEESLRKLKEQNKGQILVAAVGGKVVGNVFISDWWGEGGFIFHLAVRKEYRGQKIGTQLMDEAERRLKERGVKEVGLYVVVGHESEAFFLKRGYHQARIINRYFGKKI